MNQVANIEQADRHDKVIDLAQERFTKLAPAAMQFDAEKGYAIQLLENNPYLMKAAMENKGSLLQAITNVASIGLSLNPAKKQAYLIPRNVKVGNQWVTKVFLEPSFVGLCDLATQSGTIDWVQARCVYEKDKFIDNGVGEKPTHEFDAFSKDRGAFVGVYCVAKTTAKNGENSDYLTGIMEAAKVNDIMERSESVKAFRAGKTKSGGPWFTDFEEMSKKTIVRRDFKMWPKSPAMERLEEAVNMSNENQGFEPILTAPQVSGYTADQKKYYDQMITENNAIGMFLFSKSIDEGVWIDLYHSFQKGEKGKYQRIVDNLTESGRVQLTDCVTAINEAEDEHGIIEVIESASEDELAYYLERCSEEACAIIKEIQQ